MSTNKRPRKQYRPRAVTVPILRKAEIDLMKSVFTDATLLCQMSMTYGMLTFKEAAMIRDALNFSKVIFVMEQKNFTDDFIIEADEVLAKGSDAFGSWYRRGVEAGALHDDNVRFIVKSDELEPIIRAFDYADALIQEKIQHSPVTAIKWFQAMQRMLDGAGCGRLEISSEGIERAMHNKTVKMHALEHYLERADVRKQNSAENAC